MIKKILLNNWRPKLACLMLACALWYLIRLNVEVSIPGSPEPVRTVITPAEKIKK